MNEINYTNTISKADSIPVRNKWVTGFLVDEVGPRKKSFCPPSCTLSRYLLIMIFKEHRRPDRAGVFDLLMAPFERTAHRLVCHFIMIISLFTRDRIRRMQEHQNPSTPLSEATFRVQMRVWRLRSVRIAMIFPGLYKRQ